MPGERKMAMRVEGRGGAEVVADVKLDHGRSAKPGKQPHCEYEAEEAGRCRPWRLCLPISPVFSEEGRGGCGRSVVPSASWDDGARFPRRIGAAWEPVRPITTRVFFGRAMRRSCQLRSGWLGDRVGVGEIPSAESVFQIFKNGSRGDPSVGPCISIEILTSQGRIIGSQEIVQGPHGPPTAEGAAS